MPYPEVCPNGHVGRGILISQHHCDCGDGAVGILGEFECETCHEVWSETDCEDLEEDEES